MAWGNKKDETQPTFEETFGMTKEQFDARMQEAQAATTRATELETKFTIDVQDLRSQLEALKAPPTNPTNPEPTNFFADPEKAFGERIAPVAALSLQTNASLAEMRARTKYAKDYSRWGDEIDKLAEGHQNLAQKGDPQFWENIVNIIRGRHAQEIEESAAKGQFYFTEPAGGGGTGGSNDSPESKLSKDELAAAARLKMTPAEFLKNQEYVLNNYGHTKGAAIVH